MRKTTLLISFIASALSLLLCHSTDSHNLPESKDIGTAQTANISPALNTCKKSHTIPIKKQAAEYENIDETIGFDNGIRYSKTTRDELTYSYAPIDNINDVHNFNRLFYKIVYANTVNGKTYIYGEDKNGDLKLCIFNDTLSEYTEIDIGKVGYCGIAIGNDGSVYTCDYTEMYQCIVSRFSPEGELLAQINLCERNVYAWCFPVCMHVTENDELLIAVSCNMRTFSAESGTKGQQIYRLDKELNFKNTIFDNEVQIIENFIEYDGKVYAINGCAVYQAERTFYEIDFDSSELKYSKKIYAYYIRKGFGKYDYLYADPTDGYTYGYHSADDSAEYICDHFISNDLFYVNDRICDIVHSNNSFLTTFTATNTDTKEVSELCTISDASRLEQIKILPSGKIQAVGAKPLKQHSVHYIDTKTGNVDSVTINKCMSYRTYNVLTTDRYIIIISPHFVNDTHICINDLSGNLIKCIQIEDNFILSEAILTNDNNVVLSMHKATTRVRHTKLLDVESGKLRTIHLDIPYEDHRATLYDGKENYFFFIDTNEGIYSKVLGITNNNGNYTYETLINNETILSHIIRTGMIFEYLI